LTTAETTNAEETIDYLRALIGDGEQWYVALLRAMARWTQAEETLGERHYRYLIGGDAFDWLLLAERLIDELDGLVSPEDRDSLLFHGHPPIELDEEEFQRLIGTPKYQAHLNYLYGVIVEEALQLAIEEEVAKDSHAHVWSRGDSDNEPAFQRLYGRGQQELLHEFLRERGSAETDTLQLTELKEFTYWLFKYRVRMHEGARVASDTRKGLAALSRVEAAFRRRTAPPETATSLHHYIEAEG
jgi:hypothetical protein